MYKDCENCLLVLLFIAIATPTQIEELYFKLEEQNTKIYVERCKKFHASKSTPVNNTAAKSHARSSSMPVLGPARKYSADNDGLSPIQEEPTSHPQGRSRSFSFIPGYAEDRPVAANNPPLFLWSVQSLCITGAGVARGLDRLCFASCLVAF